MAKTVKTSTHDNTTNVVKFPYAISRRAFARRPRCSDNGTPEERAAKAALTRAQAAAGTNPDDPAFGLIAEKLATDIAHCEAIDVQNEAETEYGIGSDESDEADDRSEAACDAVNVIDRRLATTPPTTLAGIAAVLRFANQIEDDGLEWPDTDAIGPDGWHYQLRATMAAAIETLIKAPAGKAVQS